MFLPSYNTLKPRSSRYSSISRDLSSDILKPKVNHIARLNLKSQDIDICACEECIYSRQLNRKSKIGLDMSKHTSYRNSYHNRSIQSRGRELYINPQEVNRQKRKQSAVVNNSIYLQTFKDRPQEKIVKARPVDQLAFKGPVKGHSAYNQSFIAFRNNANPYIKPANVFVPNKTKMRLESVYRSNYNGLTASRSLTGKQADNLRGGLPWTGNTMYRQSFTIPTKTKLQPLKSSLKAAEKSTEVKDDTSCQSSRVSQSLQHLDDSSLCKEGNYKHQYETIYRNEYMSGKKKCGRGGGEVSRLLAFLQI